MLSCYLFLLVLFASLFVDLLSCWLVCLFDCSLSVSLSGCLVINLCCGNQGRLQLVRLRAADVSPPKKIPPSSSSGWTMFFFLMIEYFE